MDEILVYGYTLSTTENNDKFIFNNTGTGIINKDNIVSDMDREFNRNKYVSDEVQSNMFPVHKMNYLRFLYNASNYCKNNKQVLKSNLSPFNFQNKNKCSNKINWYSRGDTTTEINESTFENVVKDAYYVRFCSASNINNFNVCFICNNLGRFAGRNYYSNNSFVNNVATYVYHHRERRTKPRVAILDISEKHGYGTQDIFYSEKDVFYASIHLNETITGQFYEVGSEDGYGTTYNQIVNSFNDSSQLETSVLNIFREFNNFTPEIVVLSLDLLPENRNVEIAKMIKKYNTRSYKIIIITNDFDREFVKEIFSNTGMESLD